MPEALEEALFDKLAEETLRALDARLADLDAGLDVDLESGILTLAFEDGAKYIVNSHRAARQIWMAAERTAWHFDWDAAHEAWIATKSGDELVATLDRVIRTKLGLAPSPG